MRKFILVSLLLVIPLYGQFFKINRGYTESLRASIKNESDPLKLCNAYNLISAEFIKTFQSDSIRFYANKALDIAVKYGYKDQEGISYKNLALAARYSYDPKDFADQRTLYYSNINKAIEIFLQTRNKKELSICYSFLGGFYFKYVLNGPIHEYYDKALLYADSSGDKQAHGIIYCNLGQLFNFNKDQKKSVEYFDKAEKIFDSIKDTMNMMILLGRYAYTMDSLKHYDKQLAMIKRCVDLLMGGDNFHMISDVLADYANALINNKKYDEAIGVLNTALKYGFKVGAVNLISDIYRRLSKSYERKGDFGKALECYKLSWKYNSMHSSRLNNAAASMQEYLMGLERDSYKLKIYQKEIEQRNFLYISVIVVVTVLLVLVAVIYTNKRKSNKLLLEKNNLIHEQNLELEQLNKELESFCYSVSHDLKAPLRSISGYSTVLSEDCKDQLDDNAKEYLGKIVSSAGRMATLIDSLLDLSRISLRTIKKKKVNLSEIVHEISGHLEERNPGRKLKFIIAENIFAQCDSNFISIALQNLLDNAVKYTKGREESVIEFGVDRKSETEHIYFVRDNGVGYDEQYAAKLFKAFQRLHSPDEFPGTGVGLATVYRIITKHGGKIWSESVLGEGAVFYFTL